MRSVEGLTGDLPLPMSNNAFEKTSADISFCNATILCVVNLRFFTYLHKIDALKQAFGLPAAVDLAAFGYALLQSHCKLGLGYAYADRYFDVSLVAFSYHDKPRRRKQNLITNTTKKLLSKLMQSF